MKKILFYTFASYTIGTLLALLFSYATRLYPGVVTATANAAVGSNASTANLIIFIVGAVVGIIAVNILLTKWKKTAQKRLGSYFDMYIYFLVGVFAVYLAIYSALTFQLLVLPFTIYGSQLPTVVLIASFALIIGGAFLVLKSKPKYANSVALMLGIMTIVVMSHFPPWFLLIFFAGMAVYDYLAVFKLKTMLTLANIALDEKKPLPLLIKDGDITSITQAKNTDMVRCHNCAYPSSVEMRNGVYHFECPMCHRKSHNPTKYNTKTMVVEYEGEKEIYKKWRYIDWFLTKPTALGLGDLILPGACIASIALTFGSLWLFALGGAFFGF